MRDDHPAPAIELRPAERQVLVGGQPASIGARAFDLLMALYERRERVVTKNELLELVWPGLVVEENNLQVQVSTLRKVLGPTVIATIPGRGYRFTLPLSAPFAGAGSGPSAQDGTSAPDPVRTNLPAMPPLLGREGDIAEVAALMRTCPVVSVVGAGGIGKTRLALALAASDRLDAPGGRWWVELASINDASQVPFAIAGALGLQLAGSRPPHEALAAALSRQRLLLVLDNCEHLADGIAALVGGLRADAPHVRVLITSQESLKCPDEQVYRLGSLALPATTDPEEAARCGAVALFVARAHAVDPRFRLARDNVADVIDICRRLDGIPLAIELAAARVPLLGVAGLRSRLDEMFNVLTGVARMKLRRHQTLRAALEWSHGLLSDDERAVFRRIGAFAGGFTLELAQAVAHDDRIDRWQVLELLAQLIDKSLVMADGEGEPRYRLLEPTRAFALEQLAAAGESGARLRRHAEAVCEAMAECDAQHWTEPYDQRLRRLAEIGNLRAAVDWAMSPDGDRLLGIRMLGRSWFLWFGNNAAREGFERMLKLWPLPAGMPAECEASFCLGLASLRCKPGSDEVLQASGRAIELYRALGDRRRLGDALCRHSQIGLYRNDWAAVDAAVQEASSMIDDSAPLRQQALLQMVHGSVALARGDYQAARSAYERQAALYRGSAGQFGMAMALINLSSVELDVGDIDAAVARLQSVIDELQRIRAPYGLAEARGLYAVALAVRGDTADVLALAREAYDHAAPLGAAAAYKPLMAAALHHARREDAARAVLVGECAWRLRNRDGSLMCPIDLRMKAQLDAQAARSGGPVDEWHRASERLSLEQAGALAFEGAPMDSLLRVGASSA